MNPEFYTAWNVRRSLLEQLSVSDKSSFASLLHSDLPLLLGLLRRFPKCYWIWLHRKWCLLQLVELGQVDWQYEFDTIQKLLQLDARNFHGWEYRRFVVAHIEGIDPPQSRVVARCMLELEYTTSKINNNISNYSAWHNRSRLISQLFLLPGVPPPFSCPYQTLVSELAMIKTGMYMDSDDSLVWLYMQWLLTNPIFVGPLKSGSSPQDYQSILRQQLDDVEELNQLEREEHPQNLDHCWCLKTIVFIKSLLAKEVGSSPSESRRLREDIATHLAALKVIDPLRRGKYEDVINNLA